MTHLFICREYPPAAYQPGGIGTYVQQVVRLLAATETVHVIAQLWEGAPRRVEETENGRLIVHRVALDDPAADRCLPSAGRHRARVPLALLSSDLPSQAFAWQAALLAEALVEDEGIDVIEAQEWEAPLYSFQLRRALGLGPRRQPPCIVHLHSPTEEIFRANEWDTRVSDFVPAIRCEEYSIGAADAVLCPSRFLADRAISRYRLPDHLVHVIPYPHGHAPHLERDARVWAGGSLCYVGRLEPRKGVLELAEAAAILAADFPAFHLELFGGDTPLQATGGRTVGEAMRDRLPPALRGRVRFHGSRPRGELLAALAGAWATVVPSRWENLPYSCIEPMCTGLPVIVAPEGGMRELVRDGESGWIASSCRPGDLAATIRRALETPPAVRARMGAAAERRVREVCADDAVIGRHLDLKARIVAGGAGRSLRLPAHLCAGHGEERHPRHRGARRDLEAPERGIGVVVTSASTGARLDACLDALDRQCQPPACVAVALLDGAHTPDAARFRRPGRIVIDARGQCASAAADGAARRLLEHQPALAGLTFLDDRLLVEPAFLACADRVLSLQWRAGIVSSWTLPEDGRGRPEVGPCAAVPFIWLFNDVARHAVIRARAYIEAGGHRRALGAAHARYSLFNTIIERGWAAVTVPTVLATTLGDGDAGALDEAARAAMRQELLERVQDDLWVPSWIVAHLIVAARVPGCPRRSMMAHAVQRGYVPAFRWWLACAPEERRALLRRGLGSPRRAVHAIGAEWSRRFPRRHGRMDPGSDTARRLRAAGESQS